MTSVLNDLLCLTQLVYTQCFNREHPGALDREGSGKMGRSSGQEALPLEQFSILSWGWRPRRAFAHTLMAPNSRGEHFGHSGMAYSKACTSGLCNSMNFCPGMCLHRLGHASQDLGWSLKHPALLQLVAPRVACILTSPLCVLVDFTQVELHPPGLFATVSGSLLWWWPCSAAWQ